MKIGLGSDHGGLILKKAIKDHLENKGHDVTDYGTYNGDSCDYPDYGEKVAEAVVSNEVEYGVLICGTGLGISMAANKVKGIRAAHVSDVFTAEMAKKHNNANIIALGERVVGIGLALKIIDEFFEVEFEGGRHAGRVQKIMDIENKYFK